MTISETRASNKSSLTRGVTSERLLTFLAVIGVPAAVVVIVVEHGLSALRVVLHDAWTHVAAFFGLLVPSDEIVELSIHNDGPVDGVQVAELRVFLDADGTTRDVPQVVQTDVLQTRHLKDHESIVVEEIAPTDDREVWKQGAQAVQTGHPKQQQVVRDHGQLGETEGAKHFLVDDVVVFVSNEEDLQVSLHHGAVL